MKKFIILFLLLGTIHITYAQYVDKKDAEEIAINFMGSKISGIARSASQRNIQKTTTHTYNDHNSYYVVNFENGGFVIVSGTEEYEPIIAYSEDGFYNEENTSPSHEWWMSQYDLVIDDILKKNLQTKQYEKKWESLKKSESFTLKSLRADEDFRISRFHLVSTKWGQSGCYNGQGTYNKFVNDGGKGATIGCSCNKCPTGCVATAMAQIMKYWNYAINYNFDWGNMPNSLGTNTTQIDAVARLMAELGTRVKMQYCREDQCQSGAYSYDAVSVLKYYGYSAKLLYRGNTPDWLELLADEVDTGRPVYMSGSGVKGGHAWVVDGRDRTDPNYFYFNWGWDGYNDGYYHIDNENEFSAGMDFIGCIQPPSYTGYDNSLHVGRQYDALGDVNYPYLWNPPLRGYIENGDISVRSHYRTINAGLTATYKANKRITLTDGFTAEAGSKFTAKIVHCPCEESIFGAYMDDYYADEESLNNTVYTNLYIDNSIKIYPNPVTDIISIDLGNEFKNIDQIQIFHINGSIIQSLSPSGNIENIDLSGYNSGTYTLRIIKKDGTYKYHKFIKN